MDVVQRSHSVAIESLRQTLDRRSVLDSAPRDKFTVNLLLRQHGLETTLYAIEETAIKRCKVGGEMERPYALRLVGAIACSVTRRKRHLAAA
jgi:hypothetical protein